MTSSRSAAPGISVYADEVPGSEYHEGCKNIWTVPCDIAMPCASQNEMDLEGAKAVIANGAMAVFEGANMPLTPEAINAVIEAGLLYTPGKASNAGGVAHLRSGNEPELPAHELELRRSRREAARHHEEHL